MKAVVTGAHGFLGRHVARTLAEAGHCVWGIGHGVWPESDFRKFGITNWCTSDVTLAAMEAYADSPDLIIHCCGSGSVGNSIDRPYQDYGSTVSSTVAVLEYMRTRAPSSTLVYPSSGAVYGRVEKLPIDEELAAHPASPYGVHKLMAELLCRSYSMQYSISTAIVRCFSLYGEELRKQLLWDACNSAKAGRRMFSGTGAELRDWLHVSDAARLITMASRHASPDCPVVNGGTGVKTRVSDMLAEIFRVYGVDGPPAFSGAARPGDPPGYQADIKAATAWGWNPEVHWKDGVRRYVSWFKSLSQ